MNQLMLPTFYGFINERSNFCKMFRTLFLVLVPSIWYLWPCSCHDSHSMWAEEMSWDLLCVLVSESFRSEESWELSWNQHGDLTSGVTWRSSDLRPPFLLHQTSSLLGIFMQFNCAHGLGVSAVMGLCFPCFEHQAWCDTYCFGLLPLPTNISNWPSH